MDRNSLLWGILWGLMVPIAGVALFYTIKYLPQNVSVADFVYLLRTNKPNISKVISLGLIACIPLITYFKNRRRYQTLKGIFISIGFYALLAIAYRFHFL
ncbi:MAG TPA: hypothetical protein PLP14_01050 [Chitinophagaceae bacterium]|nr:hypothetical protein [Chitinophagaceae bacterium]